MTPRRLGALVVTAVALIVLLLIWPLSMHFVDALRNEDGRILTSTGSALLDVAELALAEGRLLLTVLSLGAAGLSVIAWFDERVTVVMLSLAAIVLTGAFGLWCAAMSTLWL